MNIAILDVRRGRGRKVEGSYMVAYRNLAVLRDELCADLFVSPEQIRFDKKYDVIICGFGSTSTERELSTRFLTENKTALIVWLIGEYEQSTFAPLFYSGREFIAVKNYEHRLKNRKCAAQEFVNINALLAKVQNQRQPKSYGAIYYGRWRPGRERYFKKYLKDQVTLSTHKKNMKHFHYSGCSPKMVLPLSWIPMRETLNLFTTSIYIEDEFTHSHYNCLANRYYEALACNVVPVFDKTCIGTLSKSNCMVLDSWIIDGYEELVDLTENVSSVDYDKVTELADYAIKERGDVVMKIKAIINRAV